MSLFAYYCYSQEQEKERNKAFDLLDALTKSGALSVDQASLHVIIASTHCFDKTIINTLVQVFFFIPSFLIKNGVNVLHVGQCESN